MYQAGIFTRDQWTALCSIRTEQERCNSVSQNNIVMAESPQCHNGKIQSINHIFQKCSNT